MIVLLVTPAAPGSQSGNWVTAERWSRLLRELGHRVRVARRYDGRSADVMIALHARRSFPAIRRFHREHADKPLVVALGGTDLYRDLRTSASARTALEWAARIVVLQPLAIAGLRASLRPKARVVVQSARRASRPRRPPRREFRVCVLSHLRPLKDPLRVAAAARLLPPTSRIHIVHMGRALTSDMAVRARREEARNPRYRWAGARPHAEALRVLAGSRVLVLPSTLEGGANVISEALAAGVPVLASRIPGSIGLLGARYPGYFTVRDTTGLTRLLKRCETDARFYRRLRAWCTRLSPKVRPEAERSAWDSVLKELSSPRP